MNFSYNEGQIKTIKDGIDWYFNSPEQVFQIAGNPGTGKSVVLNAIVSGIGVEMAKTAPMAYTGSASIIMRMKGLTNARTIHSTLYDPVEKPILDNYGNPIMDSYFNKPMTEIVYVPKDLNYLDLMIIDEGSMVPETMREDIESRGKKILVAGDLDQLLPVAGRPAYLHSGKVHVLDQIMRQAEGSPIVYLCQRAKAGLPIHTGLYGQSVLVVSEDEVTNDMLRWAGIVLCGKNVTRENLNNKIRKDLCHRTSPYPQFGEKVICRKNNWSLESGGINLTNGLTGVVVNNPDPSTFNKDMFSIDFVPDLTNIPFNAVDVDYKYFIAPYDQKKFMKDSKYSFGNKFEFGYAQTVHLAQGNQWTHGIYFEEFLHQDTNSRLNYTALSRFSHKCIYVKQKRKFY